VASAARGRTRSLDKERNETEHRPRAMLTPRSQDHSQAGAGRDDADAQWGYSRGRGHGTGRGKGGGRGGHGYNSQIQDLAPLPRPGIDKDGRLEQIEDDPRYFQNAELGKAQRAALGETGLAGKNTASFDPSSTIVRPSMRVIHGPKQKRYDRILKYDDVVMVPDFVCAEDDTSMFKSLVDELTGLPECQENAFPQLATCRSAVRRMCRYFYIDDNDCNVHLVWSKKSGEKRSLTHTSTHGKDAASGHCSVCALLGSPQEWVLRHDELEDRVCFEQPNGALLFLGRDVSLRWHYGASRRSGAQQKSDTFVTITVTGASSKATEEALSEPKRPDVCKSFLRGNCYFGDRCKYAHCRQDDKAVVHQRKPIQQFEEYITRPGMRIITVATSKRYPKPVRHDDVIVVPNFYCAEDDWSLYYELIKEMRQCQAEKQADSEWISWHEGAHLLSKNPTGSAAYQRVLDRMCEYFSVAPENQGTRFNWYRDGSDWKPFHHDSAAFNPWRAKTQNCTIGISFGAARELAFRHAKTGELIYFPQTNGMLFYFGRDANIRWQHGINALPHAEQDGKGRISIILWGLCTTAVDEQGSPGLLDDGQGGGSDIRRNHKGGQKGNPGACRDYQRRGYCSYGDRCCFSHETAGR